MMQACPDATLGQLVRYGVVGLLNNLLGYLIYVAVTWLWIEPKLAVTLMYPVGALIGYLGHARYAFQYNGRVSDGLLRYTIANLIGYCADVGMLYVLADRLGYPHQLVQAAAIFVVAGLLFVLFRYFVFPRAKQSP
jgi:putative flippase GtrA